MKKKFLILWFLFPFFLLSQSPHWKMFDNYNTNLPTYYDFKIALDSLGNKWITTYAGLFKVKDFNWTLYNTYSSDIPTNNLHDIVIDRYNRKWICSDSGLIIFNDTTWFVYNEKNAGFYDSYANSIYFDKNENIWVQGYYCYKFDGANWAQILPPAYGLKTKEYYFVYQENNGTYWFGTDSGLVKYNVDNAITYTKKNSGLPVNLVNCMYVDSDGTKWFGTIYGLVKYDDKTWTVFDSSSSKVKNIHVNVVSRDKKKNLWVSTVDNIVCFDGSNWIDLNDSLGYEFGGWGCITVDKYNNKWISGWANGLSHILLYNEDGIVNDFSGVNEEELQENSPFFCYPQPVSSAGRLIFDLKKSSVVSLSIHDLFGREILKVLNDEWLDSGTHGIYFDASDLPSGFYICVLKYNNQYETLKIVKVKN